MIKKKQIGQKLADKDITAIYSGASTTTCGASCKPGCDCRVVEAFTPVNTHLNTWKGFYFTNPEN